MAPTVTLSPPIHCGLNTSTHTKVCLPCRLYAQTLDGFYQSTGHPGIVISTVLDSTPYCNTGIPQLYTTKTFFRIRTLYNPQRTVYRLLKILQTFLHSLIHPRKAKGPIWSVGYNPNQTVLQYTDLTQSVLQSVNML